MYENWLMHHGILGQKWGVRRFQNADGSLTAAGRERYARKEQKRLNKQADKAIRTDYFRKQHTVPAGTKMYRTTTRLDESAEGPTYVSYLDADRYNYRGGWVRNSQKADKSYEVEYKLKSDLKVPSRDELSQSIYGIVKNNPSLMKETASKWFDFALPEGSISRYEILDSVIQEKEYKDGSGNKWDKAAKDFVKDLTKRMNDMPISNLYYMSAQSFGVNPKLKNAVIDDLKKRGFHAMTDEASVGGQNGWGREGIDPLIIFDRSVLEQTKVTPISRYDEANSAAKANEWRAKARGTGGEWGVMDGEAL